MPKAKTGFLVERTIRYYQNLSLIGALYETLVWLRRYSESTHPVSLIPSRPLRIGMSYASRLS
jgi:hypothetical protein